MAGATRLSIISRASGTFDAAKRRSTLLATPASNRASQGPGFSGLAPNSQSQTLGNSALQNSQNSQNSVGSVSGYTDRRDQRPLRDRNYQSLILQEILDFLTANRFEVETGHSVTLKTLRQPTQKDFVVMFQFLYGRLDPHHRFTRAIDSEVFVLLRLLSYPYLDGINRLSISAVGGQNWPAFLGMLYWLVKVNLAAANINTDTLVAPDDAFDRVFIRYIISAYRAFIEHHEDYADLYAEMKRAFDEANTDVLEAVAERQKAGKQLQVTYDELNRQHSELAEAEAKSRALEKDLQQFGAYMVQMKARQARWGELLEEMRLEIAAAEKQRADLETERVEVEAQLSAKGVTASDIDKANTERDRIARAIDAIANRIEDVRDAMASKETELRQSTQSLESFVGQYNGMARRIPVTSGDDAMEKDNEGNEGTEGANAEVPFVLTMNDDIANSSQPLEPENILDRLLRLEKVRLLLRRAALTAEIHQIQEETIRVVEQADQLAERIFDQQEEIEAVEAAVTKNKATQDDMYETMVGENTSYSAQIERLDRELQGMQIHVNKGVIEAETRHKNLKIAHQEWKYHIKEQREVLHDTVQKLIDYIISFKLNVQENIEDLDALTLRELEAEQR